MAWPLAGAHGDPPTRSGHPSADSRWPSDDATAFTSRRELSSFLRASRTLLPGLTFRELVLPLAWRNQASGVVENYPRYSRLASAL